MLRSTMIAMSVAFILSAGAAWSETMTVPISAVAPKSEPGKPVGTVTLTDTQYGMLITPDLHGLTPCSLHGFHVHQNPNCGDNGMAAGGHLDPAHTNKHLGPYNADGHLGDLPALTVNKDGNVTLPVLAPRLKVVDVKDHSLMIHEGGDNYSDNPPLGGGGTRMYCGVVK